MTARSLREAVAPTYLFLCLVLGGSAQGVWVSAILQLMAVSIIAWAAIAPDRVELTPAARRLFAICAVGLLIVFIQLIPLPPMLWTALPGREIVADGYRLLGQPLPWMALTLVPDETLTTLLRLLPPAAILVAMLRLRAFRPLWMSWALIAGTFAGVILGALQVTSGAGQEGPWYPYPISNFGNAVGFFANGNHMAILLVATIPFIFAMMANGRRERGRKALQRRSALIALGGGMLVVVLLGLILNKSLAGIGLGLPVLAASAVLLIRQDRQSKWLTVPALLMVLAIVAIFTVPVSAGFQSLGAQTSVESRRAVTATSWQAALDFMPVGSGLGSFERVYRLYEDPRTVDRTFVNHAHNDYLEMAVEAGLPGVLWLLLFLAWWVGAARNRWADRLDEPFAKAGTIASAAILAHSLVDYPLRTTAMAGVFAMAIALMVQRFARQPERTESDIRPARHLEIR